MPTLQRLLVSYVLITLVVLISDRNRALAGILGTAPMNIPIILWVIWGRNGGDFVAVQDVAQSMLPGIFSTGCYIAVCWYGFSQRWAFVPTLAFGYVVWAIVVYGPTLARWLLARQSP